MPRTLSDLVKEKFGINTYENINPVVAAIGAAEVVILRKNPNRVWASIINTSANVEYVLPAQGVSAARGIALAANGGSIILDYTVDLELLSKEWWGIAPAGASNILVIEQLIQGSIPPT